MWISSIFLTLKMIFLSSNLSTLTRSKVLGSFSLSRNVLMVSCWQLPGAWRTVRVMELVQGQNLNREQLSDHTLLHTPGPGARAGSGELMGKEGKSKSKLHIKIPHGQTLTDVQCDHEPSFDLFVTTVRPDLSVLVCTYYVGLGPRGAYLKRLKRNLCLRLSV